MYKVRFDSEEQELLVGESETFLTVYEKYDSPLMFGCMEGNCGTCKIRIIENYENLSQMELKEKEFLASIDAAENERLACQCSINGNVVLEIADFGADPIF